MLHKIEFCLEFDVLLSVLIVCLFFFFGIITRRNLVDYDMFKEKFYTDIL